MEPELVLHRVKCPGKSPAADRRSIVSTGSKEKKKYLRATSRTNRRSDSEESEDDSMDSEEQPDSQDSKSSPGKAHKRALKHGEWEILQGLRDGQRCEDKPKKYEGFMMKRRKWPMKGWHKRFFFVDKGILTYAKNASDMIKGKNHGTIDIGLAVLAYKRQGRRIDIDAEDLIYHLKLKSVTQFDDWLAQLHQHRLYRQHEIAFGTSDAPRLTDVTTPVEDLTPVTSPVSPGPLSDRTRGSFKSRTLDRTQSKVAAWLLDSRGLEHWNKELQHAQSKLFELGTLLEKMRPHVPISPSSISNGSHSEEAFIPTPNPLSSSYSGGSITYSTPPPSTSSQAPLRPPRDKASRKALKASKKERKSQESLPIPNGNFHTSASNPNMLYQEGEKIRPASVPEFSLGALSSDESCDQRTRESFVSAAIAVHESLKVMSRSITTERERLKCAIEQESGQAQQNNPAYVQALKQALQEAHKQNQDYRTKLARIHGESAVNAPLAAGIPSITSTMMAASEKDKSERPLLAASGSWESQSEFYDAPEFIQSSGESSEEEEEEEISSDISDTDATNTPNLEEGSQLKLMQTGRRNKLPVSRPNCDVSLWSLLYKNIGKDLSRISMPVTLNEPLSFLQRMCEELEYSELLDKAADTDDPYSRMVMMAAFAVSSYSSSFYRASSKPFNPLLGETYECIREDKGWRFVAEQVSHHPPVSASYCESKNFVYWQDVKVKTKFWGKSMEGQPIGNISVKLPKYKDHYEWNKVTSCIHNLLGGQRWVDHYGEVIINNHANGIRCKLTFTKSSYWSSKRHEVYGSITDPEGRIVHHLFGKWNEGLYCGHAPSAKCIWRPGSMPEDYDLYYGFTRFAIELNEKDSDQVHLYPATDSRFRPDQGKLEEGKVSEAEQEKLRIELSQRERRKHREEEKVTYSPKWFMRTEEGKKEMYMYTGKYWELRKDPGFLKMTFNPLW